MTIYVITEKGHELLRKGPSHVATMLEVASSIADDGLVSEEELMREFDLNPEEARKTLLALQQLDLVRPAVRPKSTPFRQDIRRRGGL